MFTQQNILQKKNRKKNVICFSVGAYILHTFRHQDLRKWPLGKTFIFQAESLLTLVWDHTCQESEAECSGSSQLPHALTVPSAQIFHKVLPHEKHHNRADGHKQQIPEMI